MSKQTIKLLRKDKIADDTMAFYWEMPEGFEFKAGQFGDFTLINPDETDDKGNSREFSFVHAPSENELVTATRMRDSAYKRELEKLPEGAEVEFDGPIGNFKLHKTESTPAVFIIGGIGITPIRSMIAEATKQQTSHNMTLLYANSKPKDAPFLEDFRAFEKENPNFKFVPVMTQADSDEWNGESGYIDADMLKRYVSDVSEPIYYLSGPGDMVNAMYDMLVEAGANEDNIRAEAFYGY
ncbi:FAD-dependent oxidoreductase [Lentibacillus sp.]|uniref:FAD-dependent oxidoreductase n=1 Tax=Lentibacillus sp. TaxID=1925746 RepID=UPI002B4B5FA8|nr:FAD-dependent oxidoreductase [Lentibacillus sp.]HLS07856.1 FAD-dependent oxidoreductase [Lentibacillus sp.]